MPWRKGKRDGKSGWTPHKPRRNCPPHLFIDRKAREGHDEHGNPVIYHFQVCDTCGADNMDIEYIHTNGKGRQGK